MKILILVLMAFLNYGIAMAASSYTTTAPANTTDVTIGTANGLSLAGQVLSLQAATNAQPGALTAADHTAFTAKEPSITAGTSAQYWRGDKTMQTLNQAAVAGLTTADSPLFTAVTAGSRLKVYSVDSVSGGLSTITSDGSDNNRLQIAGGGAPGNTRGAYANISGNEAANPGCFDLLAGNVTGGHIRFYTGAASERVRVVDSTGNVLINTTTDNATDKLQVSGSVTATVLRATTSSTPASNAVCSAGTFYWDASYIYVCTASGVVKRSPLTGGY